MAEIALTGLAHSYLAAPSPDLHSGTPAAIWYPAATDVHDTRV